MISSIGNSYAIAPRAASRATPSPASFKEAMTQATSSAVSEVITASDGTKWTKIDIGKALTDNDKAILGWPSSDPKANMVAALVASDRVDGSLSGSITRDYILGNREKNIPGLVDREPAGTFSRDRLAAMLRNLAVSS